MSQVSHTHMHTDGLVRGKEVVVTRAPLSVLVGRVNLDQIFNVIGEPFDNLGPVDTCTSLIHRFAPAFIYLKIQNYLFLKHE